ncbi:4520_t:CDS:1 [Entrophospora sp. SA101]|nr:4520_t:CDS:1 [Entrophospora sp. SA101]CAJ0835479.1 15667_t:CDS:1 [Entrophospora sp. SA101]
MNLESLIQLSANIHPSVNNNNIDAGNISNVSPISTPTSTPIHTPPQQSFMVNSTNNNNNYAIFSNDIVVCNDNNGNSGDCNNRFEPLYNWSPDSINSSEFTCDGCQL